METAYSIILTLHIVFGSLSLITFWIPVLVKKGGDIHVKVGKLYVILMWVVVVSAATLCILNVFRGRINSAIFLGYLSLITSQPLWYGITILKYRKNIPAKVHKINMMFNWAMFLGGLGLIALSIKLNLQGPAILLLIFGSIGTLTSAPMIFSRKEKKVNWLAEHIQGMVITGIAAYTAFFAFGGSTFMGHLFSGSLVAIPWILPTVIGVFVIKRYKAKMNLA